MFHTIKTGSLEYLTADSLSGSVHCFSTRFGGVSEGHLASLNLGTHRGDVPENVRENYRILGAAAGFAPEQTVFTKQEHTDTILRVGRADCGTGLSREQAVVCENVYTDRTPDELRADFAAKAAANGQLDYDFDKAVQAFCKRKYASDFSREMTRSAEIYWKEFL